jgi:hypothetical protein
VTQAGTLTAGSTGVALAGRWLNSAGTSVASQTGAPGLNLAYAVKTPGSYYLSVKGATAATTGAYQVSAAFTPAPVTGQPEIGLVGRGSTALADGDLSPTAAKGTDFAVQDVGADVTQVFTIKNSGKAPLTLGAASLSGPGASQFRVVTQPAASVAAGRSTTLVLAFSPNAAGLHNATLILPNNDANENPYDIALAGTGRARVGDDHGDTRSTATSVALPNIKFGNLSSNDVDMFKITLPAAATVTLSSNGPVDTYARLLNSNGNVITEADDDSEDELNFTIQRSLAAGTYYLEVSGYDEEAVGDYEVEFLK